MTSFSERHGYQMPPTDLPPEAMPKTLRAGLWDIAKSVFFQDIHSRSAIIHGVPSDQFDQITKVVWFHFYRVSVDERPQDADRILAEIRARFYAAQFEGVYDFIEFMAKFGSSSPIPGVQYQAVNYTKTCNLVLERERAAFRFADSTLVRISDPIERDEIEAAIQLTESPSISSHIRRAAELYSQNPQPDYRNSIKESISAVEAAASILLGRRSDGVAKPLREVADQHDIHPALREGFEKLYAWTSDEQGIRHRILDKSSVTQDDARYMLVSCSAFSNYLVALQVKHKKTSLQSHN